MQINVEGWTFPKREILEHLVEVHKANIVLVQETHQLTQDKLKLYGFELADFIPSSHHGIATFVKHNLCFSHVNNSCDDHSTEWISIKVEDIVIMNAYHPPTAVLDITSFPETDDQFVLAGDLNCKHETWGYSDSNTNGEQLATWASANNLLTLFDPKQAAAFHSGRWNSGTNPNVCSCTQLYGITLERSILERFLRSQHRPSLITTPL